MQDFAVLDRAVIRGGVPQAKKVNTKNTLEDIELFLATITPAGAEHGCICDIEVFETDLVRATMALEAMGATIDVRNVAPPLQTLIVDFGVISVPEAVEKLSEVFETDAVSLDAPTYWFRFNPDPQATPEMFVIDKIANRRTLLIFQDESNVRHPLLTLDKWFAFGDELEAMTTASGQRICKHVAVGDGCVGVVLTEVAVKDFILTATAIAYRFPQL